MILLELVSGVISPYNTKSGTLVLTKCIYEERQQGNGHESSIKVLKQKIGKNWCRGYKVLSSDMRPIIVLLLMKEE